MNGPRPNQEGWCTITLAADTQARLAIALVSPAAATDIATNINTPSPGATNVTSTSAKALTVAAAGANYGLQVDESTASAATGLKIKPAAAGAGLALTVITSGTNENLTIDAAGNGQIILNGTTVGVLAVQIGGAASGANATGLTLTPAAAGSGFAIGTVSTGSAEKLTIDAKGTGAVIVGGTSTGYVVLGRGSASAIIESGAKAALGSGNVTATAAQLIGGYVTGAQNANTMTTDTAANIDAAIPGVATGDTFMCAYFNSGAGNGTITGGTGVTVRGTSAVIPTSGVGLMFFQRTGAAAYDVLVVGKN